MEWACWVITGALAGFFAGLLGIGGGFIVVPAIMLVLPYVGIGGTEVIKIAMATSLAIIIPTSLASLQAHAARGAVDWRALGRLAPGVMAGSVVGAVLSTFISSQALTVLFGVLMLFAALRIFMTAETRAAPVLPLPDVFGLSFSGVGIGVVSALIGGGGAFISIPVLARYAPIHRAIGTASALGFPLAIGGVASFLLLDPPLSCARDCVGYVFLPAVSTAGMAAVLTAPWGARLAHATPVGALRRIFACVLILIAGGMMHRAALHTTTVVALGQPPSGQVLTKVGANAAGANENGEQAAEGSEDVMLARGVRYGPLRGMSGLLPAELHLTSVHDWGGGEQTSASGEASKEPVAIEAPPPAETLPVALGSPSEIASVERSQNKAEGRRKAHSHSPAHAKRASRSWKHGARLRHGHVHHKHAHHRRAHHKHVHHRRAHARHHAGVERELQLSSLTPSHLSVFNAQHLVLRRLEIGDFNRRHAQKLPLDASARTAMGDDNRVARQRAEPLPHPRG
jgi:uncharacterized protein